MSNLLKDYPFQHDYAIQKMIQIIWTLFIIDLVLLLIITLLSLSKRFIPKLSNNILQDIGFLYTEIESQISQSANALSTITTIIFYTSILVSTLIFGVMHGFQILGQSKTKKIITTLTIIFIGIFLHIIWKSIHSTQPINSFRDIFISQNNKQKALIILIIWVTYVGLVMFFMNGVCYCIYNDNLGHFSSSTGISTSLTRRLFLEKKVCPDNSICRVYATLPETTDTSVFINVHTGVQVEELFIVVTEMNGDKREIDFVDQYFFETSFDEEYGKRKVWTFLFNSLKPSSLYNVTLLNEHQERFETTYKSLPNFDDKASTMKIIIGGDVGLTDHGRNMFRNIGETNPDLIILGGDIAYDNAMTYCYYAWDNFYSLLDKVNTANNRLVPFIMAIGNHDIGWNSYAKVSHKRPTEKGPWYFAYNPQHFADGTNDKIPSIGDRRTYTYHKVGRNAIITLDSQYVQDYKSQGVYLQETASKLKSQGFSLFGLYHVPLYPSCIYPDDLTLNKGLEDSHKYYEPVFIKYNFTMCFQNHVHKLKRTNPISGVVYIGDGNLGVDEQKCDQQNQIYNEYMAKTMFQGSNHYWLGVFNRSHISLSAYSMNHTRVDHSMVKIRN